MKNKSILSQPSLREDHEWMLPPSEEKNTSMEVGKRQQDLKSTDVYGMLHLSPGIDDAIVKEMIAYACAIADGSDDLFPVRFSDRNGRKALVISCKFNNPMEVEELLSVSYAAYLSAES